MLTDGVSITPTPSPMSSSPGANAHALGEPFTMREQDADPDDRGDEARDDEGPLRVLLGQSLGRERRDEDADGGGVKITPVSMAL